MKRLLFIAIIFAFFLSSCSLSLTTKHQPTIIPISSILNNSGTTPTPFQPNLPTSIMGDAEIPTPTSITSAETALTSTPVDTNITIPEGQINILVFGSDYRPGRGFRTDVIMLLSLNPKKGTASLTSFPRDLYIAIPGIGMERINTAQAYGGFSLMAATFQQNFGVTPDYYMMTNFDGFKGIIDTLGGITVNAAINLTDECSVQSRVDGAGNCTIYAGVNQMDGETALWYVRSRHSTSDFDRTRREQEVLTALFQKLISLNAVNRASELYDMFKSSVETNIPFSTIVSLLPLASQLAANTSQLHRFAIGPNETYDYIVPGSGAMVLIPDQNLVMQIIRQAISQ